MTAELLSSVAGIVLSLLFSYVPGLNAWFAGLDSVKKSLIMLGALLLVAGGIYGIACIGWGEAWGITMTCDQAGLQQLVTAFILAAVSNQAAYKLSPEAAAVREAKADR